MTLPKQIDCIEIVKYGGPENLIMTKRDTPLINKNELLIKVEAAGVNRPDIMQRQGLYPPPPGASDIPGLEVAGEVVAINADKSRFKTGDKVCALVSGGGYSSYCTAPIEQTLPIPRGLSYIEAAAIPETFFTVWANVFDRGNIKKNDTILFGRESSGVPKHVHEIVNERLRIPMLENKRSLNLATSVGIVLAEQLRQN